MATRFVRHTATAKNVRESRHLTIVQLNRPWMTLSEIERRAIEKFERRQRYEGLTPIAASSVHIERTSFKATVDVAGSVDL